MMTIVMMSKSVSLKLCLAMISRRDMVMFDCYTKLVFLNLRGGLDIR
jgi:hypothetical protein